MTSKSATLIFPHQLFKNSPAVEKDKVVYLIEEHLFFKQYAFHKQKLAFHRASMQAYATYLKTLKIKVIYIEAHTKQADCRVLIADLRAIKISSICYVDTTDDWLEQRISSSVVKHDIAIKKHESPLFLNSVADLAGFFRADKKKFMQSKFYIDQRKQRSILVDEQQKAMGGKWSFDAENRKKYPKSKNPPIFSSPDHTPYYDEALSYVEKYFENNPGIVSSSSLYAIDFTGADDALEQFLEYRFQEFGSYEDAIVKQEHFLNHSVLTPMLNVGLISPQTIVDRSLDYAQQNKIPINSTEGFIRQIIGWREFIRGVYGCKGVEQRTKNFWGFTRKIPASFYDGTTGIEPVDQTIKKVLETGYCHHIERLMILGNFMLLCEFDPDEVYRWFMEMFVDAYDWVMVPNVYGMSQFADGGLMSTKPYISGSNYVLKMSDYKKGSWQTVWDGLFWRFMHLHREFFLSNPRIGMLVHTYDKMAVEKQQTHQENAKHFLDNLN